MMKIRSNFFFAPLLAVTVLSACNRETKPVPSTAFLIQDVTLIDGNGGAPMEHTDILVEGERIAAIGKKLDTTGVTVLNLSGKTIMPALISSHVHIGTLKGLTTKNENYTEANILAQLQKYLDFGVGTIQTMGTDRPLLFNTGLRDSSLKGLIPGARVFSAGNGFGVPEKGPHGDFGMDLLYRPVTASDVPAQIDSLAKLKPSVVKMWVDDFGGAAKKMEPSVYKAILSEAAKHNIRVASHLYYLSDARKLVDDGVSIIAHSIRDSVIDDQLIAKMKTKGVAYIPTLSLDEFAFIYARKPDWINDDFFKASLEPGVYEMITSKKYQDDLKRSPTYRRSMAGFEIALKNVKKMYLAGVLVAMGTDSGATPVRAQGFSEHLELELMVQAGLSPLQAISIATKNSANVLQIADQFGTIEKGKIADMIVLTANPAGDIKNTRSIETVYKAGKVASKGPLSK